MQQEQIKSLFVNILTASVVVGVFITGYFVFVKKTPLTVSEVSVVKIAEETRFIGTEIDRTVKELEGLDRSLASSLAIFDDPAFRNLEDFTVSIPEEVVGSRTNPFTVTSWKLEAKALEEALGKGTISGGTSGGTSSVGQSSFTSTPGTQTPAPVL